MSFFRDIGESIADRAGREAVQRMVASGEMDRLVEDTIAKTFAEMANEPRYAPIKDKLMAGAVSIRKKREDAERRAREARIAEYRSLPWWMRLFAKQP